MNSIGPNYFFTTQTNPCNENQLTSTAVILRPEQMRRVASAIRTSLILAFLSIGFFLLFGSADAAATTDLQATALPGSAKFGNVVVGTADTQSVDIGNDGSAEFTIISVTTKGSGFYFLNLTAPHVVHAGKHHTFDIVFSPGGPGARTGSVVIETTATNRTIIIPLSGTGTSSTPTLSASPETLKFGNDSVGIEQTLEITLKNTGNSSIKVSGVTVSDAQLKTSGSVNGATLATGQSAKLNVIYSPTKSGTFGGQVKVSSNASNSPSAIAVTGSAFAPSSKPAVALNWDASSSSGIEGYYVYRSTNASSGFVKLSSAYISGLKYTDDAVAEGTTYYYAVSAISSKGVESAKCSAEVVKVP
jgi:Protein of unknown function (DUF1573)